LQNDDSTTPLALIYFLAHPLFSRGSFGATGPFFPLRPFSRSHLFEKELLATLWIALFVGLWLDLFATASPFGITTLCVIFSCLIAYPFRKTFFEHHLLFLPLSSALISFLYTLFQWVLLPQKIPLLTALATLLISPLIDATFSFFWFTCPLILYNRWRADKRTNWYYDH
jgi:hypothetical protein